MRASAAAHTLKPPTMARATRSTARIKRQQQNHITQFLLSCAISGAPVITSRPPPGTVHVCQVVHYVIPELQNNSNHANIGRSKVQSKPAAPPTKKKKYGGDRGSLKTKTWHCIICDRWFTPQNRTNHLRRKHFKTVEEYRKLVDKEAKRQLERAERQGQRVSVAVVTLCNSFVSQVFFFFFSHTG